MGRCLYTEWYILNLRHIQYCMKYIIPSEKIKQLFSFNLTNVTVQAYAHFSGAILSKSLRFYASGAQNSALVLN